MRVCISIFPPLDGSGMVLNSRRYGASALITNWFPFIHQELID